LLKKLEKLHDEIELAGGWSIDAKVRKVAQQLNLELDAKFATLSGGVKRRALLARAIVSEPDLLLLDEPTNHLDIVQIQWLESYLENFPGSVIFISHDRRFVERLARRVVEIDRGQLLSWHGSYQNYLKRQQKLLLEQEEQFKLEDKKLASEEAWIRKGIKARRTRDQGRVRALQKLRETRRARRSKMGDVNINVDSELISGKRVFEVEGLSYQYSDQTPLIKNFSCEVCRGDKIAIVGANGCGKSTLVKLLLKELPPSSGRIHQGTKIQLAYFDQLQQQLDENMTLLDFVGEGRTQIEVAGTQRHIMGYLQDFLFSPQAVRSPIKVLSGGERNRLILAKILSKPANLLVLDEPTNDLDIET
ncbi:MAG TPA: ABC transporter ATP-binding protein, partial [Gammaproteobacteria bacterium]|nr:ABC transporter ATP-binding protein [Gammaproteobacteria bacterium]